MKKTMLSVVTMLFCVWGYTQELSKIIQLPKIIPPNPENASLGKHIDTPVNLAYGIPNVSIPLFSLKNKDVAIPVSLNYHTSGIKVSEIASRVGLGWSLNAGGSITRAVRGIPDDNTHHGFINTENTVDVFLKKPYNERVTIINPINGYVNDFESDIYHFNFLGYSGKFFFNQEGKPIGNPTNDLKITFIKKENSKEIDQWIITTPNGIKCYFGKSKNQNREAKDRTTSASVSKALSGGFTIPDPSKEMSNYITSWKLLDVETYKQELISLNYTHSNISFWNLVGQHQEFSIGHGTSSNPIMTFYTYNMNDITHRLTSITNNEGKIEFIYNSNQRQDLDNDFALKSIILKDKYNTIVDRYRLIQDYFTSSGQHFGPGKANQCLKRLYLKEVVQEKPNVINKRHRFEYDTDKQLPHRFSRAIDHWGYYNGKNNLYLTPSIFSYGVSLKGGDRKVNEQYAKAYSLRKIIHPTEGATEFELESNNVSNVKLNNLVTLKYTAINGFNSANMQGNQGSKIITINNLKDYEMGISFKIRFNRECTNPNGFDCPKARIHRYEEESGRYKLLVESNGKNKLDFPIYESKNSVKYKIELFNFSDDFRLGNEEDKNEINVLIIGRSLKHDGENGGKTGGLRIKSIKKRDSNGEILLEKKYSYTQFKNPTITSGTTLQPPVYITKSEVKDPEIGIKQVGLVKSNSIYPITYGSSYSSMYTNVTEYTDSDSEGKTEYDFNFISDKNGESPSSPFVTYVPTGDYSHRRGVLLNKRMFKKINNTFSLVEEENNTYSKPDFKNKTLYVKNLRVEFSLHNTRGGYAEYRNLSEPFHLKEKQKKTYENNHVVTQKTIYTYDEGYSGRTFPIKTTIVNSKGEVIKTETKYAGDVTNITSLGHDNLTIVEKGAIDNLKLEHRIAEPIQVEKNKNNVLISAQRTNYKSFDGIYLPEIIQTSKGLNALEDRVVYHSYDNKGNPTEVSKADGTHIVYIWGYNQTQPIAKIEDATLTEVTAAITTISDSRFNTLEKIQSLSNADNTRVIGESDSGEGLLRKALNSLRNITALAKAQVTTFTYDPLIGVTSITDPRGQTIYYEYDDFNRLEFVKDADGNLLKEHKYKYKN